MKILLLGARGQVGWELVRALQPLGRLQATTREMLDMSRPEEVAHWITATRPAAVVNAAAFTAVDRAEHETAAATAINAQAVEVVANACAAAGSLLFHYSTDYVFDGTSTGMYNESDTPNPVNFYGVSKLAGEQAIQNSGCNHIILRVSWVYSLRRTNFVRSIIAKARTDTELRVVSDQFGAPTPAWLIADTTAHMLRARTLDPRLASNQIVHAGCQGVTTWHGFATALLDILGSGAANEDLRLQRVPRVIPINSSDLSLAARRPSNSRMDLGRMMNEWQVRPPSWETALHLTLRSD